MASVRRLAAILASDVAGYSRLMGADEEGTHERLQAHFRELVNPKIAEHRGRIVKNTGDGFLAEFASVVDAVRCAAEVQRGMVERNEDIAAPEQIAFRIGINLGDVIAEEHDIFGDGVNVAARLEALAEPGGICVSRVVRDQVSTDVQYWTLSATKNWTPNEVERCLPRRSVGAACPGNEQEGGCLFAHLGKLLVILCRHARCDGRRL
jgi:adenylate cyclase